MINMTRKKWIIITLISVMIIVINGCQFRKKNVPVDTLSLGGIAESILYAPFYIGLSQGFFASENLDVKYNVYNNNKDLINSLKDNSSQIILAGSQITILEKNQNENSFLLNFAQLVNRDPSMLMSRDKLEDFSWSSLNKKIIIGGIPYSTPQLILEYLLIKNDLQPLKKVDVIHNIPKEACVGAFLGGVGDFIHLLEPEATKLETIGKAYLALPLGEQIGDIAYTTFITTASYFDENPEIIERFVKALYQAQLWCNYHNPEEITQELKPFFPDLDQSVILAVVTKYKNNNTWSQDPLLKQNALDKMQDILIFSGVIADKIPFDKVVNNSFAQKAIEEVKILKEYQKTQ